MKFLKQYQRKAKKNCTHEPGFSIQSIARSNCCLIKINMHCVVKCTVIIINKFLVLLWWAGKTGKFGSFKRVDTRFNYHRERFGKLMFRGLALPSDEVIIMML